MKTSDDPLFGSFTPAHERCLTAWLGAGRAALEAQPSIELQASLAALENCRNEIVNALKAAHDPAFRRELQILYQGLAAVIEWSAGREKAV